MSWLWRAFLLLLLLRALQPEFARYRAEHLLSDATGRIERVLRGVDSGASAVRAAQDARGAAQLAATLLPGDARAALGEAVALMLLGDGAAAEHVLLGAISLGERPELTLNLGRARFQRGDEPGARRAYLRSAWAAPAAISTLPQSIQDELRAEVEQLDAELAAGRLSAPPPL